MRTITVPISRLEDADAVYRDWLVTLDREDKKMMAMMMYDNYSSLFGLTNTSAAAEVAQLLGVNKKRKYFVANKGAFSDYRRASYTRYVVVMDEEYRDKALEWVRGGGGGGGGVIVWRSHTLSSFCERVWLHQTTI